MSSPNRFNEGVLIVGEGWIIREGAQHWTKLKIPFHLFVNTAGHAGAIIAAGRGTAEHKVNVKPCVS